ncbi:MAG: hypothetical protein FD150_1321 [Rhodobacteraceae bacterium]|nr:MAG: hypothetical protein FD150_1321 [Paracoccaceae bacterium]
MPFLMMFQKALSFDPPITAIFAAIAAEPTDTSAVVASTLAKVFMKLVLCLLPEAA